MYEERTEHGLSHDDDLGHAACHRQFAQDDRRMAKRARQSADKHLARRTWGEQGDGVSLSVRPRWLGPNGTPERSARTVTQVIETVSDCQLAGYVDQSCIAFLGNTFQQLKGSNRVDVEAGYKDSLGLPGEVSARQCAAKPALVCAPCPTPVQHGWQHTSYSLGLFIESIGPLGEDVQRAPASHLR